MTEFEGKFVLFMEPQLWGVEFILSFSLLLILQLTIFWLMLMG